MEDENATAPSKKEARLFVLFLPLFIPYLEIMDLGMAIRLSKKIHKLLLRLLVRLIFNHMKFLLVLSLKREKIIIGNLMPINPFGI